MHIERRALFRAAAAVAAMLAISLPMGTQAQDARSFVMKLSTATLNDTQHEWLKRFAVAVEKSSGGRIKGEVYPASQLGPIPRQIEGVQFGSIQGWIGPPEFLVGVDTRYEVLSAPGLFTTQDQQIRVINDPPVRDFLLGLGATKGLEGVGIAPIGGSSIATRKEVRRLADLRGSKVRVLASPFQLELIRRMDASPVAMTLADVLPGLQQGAIDAALGVITVFTPLQYVEVTKYVLETDQPYISSIVVMSKRWLGTLPPDLQKIVRDEAANVSKDILPFVREFFGSQRKAWIEKGGTLISLPQDEQTALVAKLASIGEDLSKDKPDLNQAIKLLFQSAERNK
ncbi:MAG: TRAP transporter substrate-binding protein [Xanthobacteraceae bacterium]